MPLYSAFNAFGHLRFSAAPSRHATIYQTLRDGQEGAYGPGDTHQEARIYAQSRCLAIAAGELERAENEGRADKTQELLAELELDYGLSPAPGETEAERRAALALQVRILRGSRKEAIEDAIETLLGDDFIAVVPMRDVIAPPTQWPATPGDVGNWSRGALYRLYTLTDSAALVGTRQLHFVDIVAGQEPLKIGDRIVLEPGVPDMAESVTVTAVVSAAVVDADGYTTNHVEVVTARPHPKTTVCTTAPMPILSSTQRHYRIQVTTSCATDAVKRAAVHQLMRRIVRGVSTWEIQTSPTELGGNLLTLNDPVLGRLDANVLGP